MNGKKQGRRVAPRHVDVARQQDTRLLGDIFLIDNELAKLETTYNDLTIQCKARWANIAKMKSITACFSLDYEVEKQKIPVSFSPASR